MEGNLKKLLDAERDVNKRVQDAINKKYKSFPYSLNFIGMPR